jgi:hypothetical protein
MAPLPADNTARFWYDYHDGQNPHTILCRFTTSLGFDITDVMAAVDDLLNALDEDLYLINTLGARFADAGSNISVPVIWTGAASYGAGSMPAVFAPRQTMFLGRDSLGRRFRVSIWGIDQTTPDNFRFASVSGNFVDRAVTSLVASQAGGAFRTISGNQPSMYNYADVQFNSHWETAARG